MVLLIQVHCLLFLYFSYLFLTFGSVDETLRCNHSNETSSAVLSHGTIYLVCSFNVWVCGWNPMVLPFKRNLYSSTFMWLLYILRCSSNFWVCGWNPMVLRSSRVQYCRHDRSGKILFTTCTSGQVVSTRHTELWNPFSSTFRWYY